jgi:acyl dehydratase
MTDNSSNALNINFDQPADGYEFPLVSCELSTSVISKYLEAVGVPAKTPLSDSDFVPPLAIGAFAFNALGKSLSLPGGTIHAGQEFEFFRLVPIGSTITFHSWVDQKVQRGRLNMLMIALEALNQDEEKVLSGKATLILPG